jgi:hypothetical protein
MARSVFVFENGGYALRPQNKAFPLVFHKHGSAQPKCFSRGEAKIFFISLFCPRARAVEQWALEFTIFVQSS